MGIVFDLKRPTFGGILSSKGREMTSIIEIFDEKMAHFGGFEGSFLTILAVKKVVLWTFSKFFWGGLESV